MGLAISIGKLRMTLTPTSETGAGRTPGTAGLGGDGAEGEAAARHLVGLGDIIHGRPETGSRGLNRDEQWKRYTPGGEKRCWLGSFARDRPLSRVSRAWPWRAREQLGRRCGIRCCLPRSSLPLERSARQWEQLKAEQPREWRRRRGRAQPRRRSASSVCLVSLFGLVWFSWLVGDESRRSCRS